MPRRPPGRSWQETALLWQSYTRRQTACIKPTSLERPSLPDRGQPWKLCAGLEPPSLVEKSLIPPDYLCAARHAVPALRETTNKKLRSTFPYGNAPLALHAPDSPRCRRKTKQGRPVLDSYDFLTEAYTNSAKGAGMAIQYILYSSGMVGGHRKQRSLREHSGCAKCFRGRTTCRSFTLKADNRSSQGTR